MGKPRILICVIAVGQLTVYGYFLIRFGAAAVGPVLAVAIPCGAALIAGVQVGRRLRHRSGAARR